MLPLIAAIARAASLLLLAAIRILRETPDNQCRFKWEMQE